jgi:hypothetical protein
MKSLLIVLCVLCLSLTAMAETPLSLGGQMGISFASMSISPNQTSTSGRTTFGVGGVFEIGISQLFWLQPEVMYSSGGVKTTDPNNGDPVVVNYNYNWIEVSPLVKLKFGHKDWKPYVFAGPKVGILTGASYDASQGTATQSGDLKDYTESLNLAIDFGAGTDFYLDKETSLFGDLRYSIGLTNANKRAGSSVSVKTSAFMIMFGAKFRID